MHPRERIPYSAIEDRKALQAAGRAAADRVAAAGAGGMGHGAADGAHGDHAAAGPADAAGPSELELARIRHAGRLLAHQAMFERLKIKPTVTVNARVCETYPQVIQACADAGWELNAHGYDQIPMHKLDDQRRSSTSRWRSSANSGANRRAAGSGRA